MTLGIFLGMAADRMLGDPPTTIHPVALFGRAATKLEKVFYSDSKLAGAFYLTAAVVPPVVATYWLEKRYPTATMTLALFSALGGTTLERIGERMARALEARDIDRGVPGGKHLGCRHRPHSLGHLRRLGGGAAPPGQHPGCHGGLPVPTVREFRVGSRHLR